MKKQNSSLLIVLAIVAVVAFWGVSQYNSLVGGNESIDGQWAQVENQLQRRSDLIPNLVNTVKGYAQHETDLFNSIAEARAKLAGNASVEDRVEAANEFESALSRLLVVVERYPELKADTEFRALMDELSGTENRLSVERGRFNETVKTFNEKVKQFPTMVIARVTGFVPRAYFEIPDSARDVPEVDFSK